MAMMMMMMMTKKRLPSATEKRHEGGGEGCGVYKLCTTCVQAVYKLCTSCVAAFEEIPTNARNWPTANSRTEEDDEDGDKQVKKSLS